MGQTQTQSIKAARYTRGIEIECFLPEAAIQQYGISIGSYHHGRPLPHPFVASVACCRSRAVPVPRFPSPQNRIAGPPSGPRSLSPPRSHLTATSVARRSIAVRVGQMERLEPLLAFSILVPHAHMTTARAGLSSGQEGQV